MDEMDKVDDVDTKKILRELGAHGTRGCGDPLQRTDDQFCSVNATVAVSPLVTLTEVVVQRIAPEASVLVAKRVYCLGSAPDIAPLIIASSR